MLHSKLLSQLYTCATHISSHSLYYSDENIQVRMLEKIAMIMPTSETLKVPRDGPFDDTKKLAVAAITKDMTKIMQELSPMLEAPPIVVDRYYIESSMYGETVSLKNFIALTRCRICDADTNLEIIEVSESKKKAKLNNGKESGLLANVKARKLELEKKLAIAQARFAFLEETKDRREWNSKIKNLVTMRDTLDRLGF